MKWAVDIEEDRIGKKKNDLKEKKEKGKSMVTWPRRK